VDALAPSRQGHDRTQEETQAQWAILGWALLSKQPSGHLASIILGNPACLPACLASCPAWARHSPTDTPAESAPACLGTLLAHLLLAASCTAGIGSGGLRPQLVLVRLAPPLGDAKGENSPTQDRGHRAQNESNKDMGEIIIAGSVSNG
jgi:hypothetical protein